MPDMGLDSVPSKQNLEDLTVFSVFGRMAGKCMGTIMEGGGWAERSALHLTEEAVQQTL